jgi:hypothetical protein
MMPMADVRQISVAGVRVGLVGLDDIFEKVAVEALASYEERASRLGTPALVINGKVVSTGRVPTRADLCRWLKEETK